MQNWDCHVPLVLAAYNSTPHRGTGVSPQELWDAPPEAVQHSSRRITVAWNDNGMGQQRHGTTTAWDLELSSPTGYWDYRLVTAQIHSRAQPGGSLEVMVGSSFLSYKIPTTLNKHNH